MARVTVEDCILNIPNRFELVVMAARRAKDIAAGGELTVDRDNDKDAVVSLREIADLTLSLDTLREEVVQSFQKRRALEKFVTGNKEEGNEALEGEIEEMFAKQITSDVEQKAAEAGMSFSDENINPDD